MNNKTLVFKNTVYLTLSEIAMKGVGFLWVIFLARSISVSQYGQYSHINAIIVIFAVMADLGIGLIAIREIAKNYKKAGNILGNVLVLKLLFSIMTLFGIFAFAGLTFRSVEMMLFIAIASVTLFVSSTRSPAVYYFEGKEQMKISAFLNVLNTVLSIGIASLALVMGYGLLGVFGGLLIGTVISAFLSWGFLLQNNVRITFEVEKKEIKYLLKQALPLGLAGLATLVSTRIDTILLSNLLSNTAAGIYNAATPFVFALVQLLNVPFVVAVYPALTRVQNESSKRFLKAVYMSLFVIGLWSFPLSLTVFFLAPFVLPFLFGNRYDSAIPILQVLIFYVPFISLSAFMYKVLIILRKQKVYLFVSILGATINIVLNISFIPIFGIMGAAYASVVTQVMLFIIYVSILGKYMLKSQ